MMKGNDGIFIMEVRMKVCVFLGDSLNKNISRKKIARLLNEESKTYKSSYQEVFSKIVF